MSLKAFVREAGAAIGADLGAPIAADQLAREKKAALRVKTVLSNAEEKRLEELTGLLFLQGYEKETGSDHKLLAAMRELLECMWENTTNPKNKVGSHCYMGAAARELRCYGSNKKAKFYFAQAEGKDAVRTDLAILEEVISELSQLAEVNDHVDIKDVPGKQRKATIFMRDLKEVLAVREALIEGKTGVKGDTGRYYFEEKDVRASHLIYLDSAYNKNKQSWFDTFQSTGAVSADATMFFPDELLYPEAPKVPEYDFRTRVPEAVSSFLRTMSILPFCLSYFNLTNYNFAVGWFCFRVFCVMWKVATALRGADLSEEVIKLAGLEEIERLLLREHDIDLPLEIHSMRLGSIEFATIAATRIVRTYLSERAEVTWPGFENGYSHPTKAWKTLFESPVMTSPFHKFTLGVQVMKSAGYMKWVKVWRIDNPEVMVRDIALPKARHYVKLLDLSRTVDLANDSLKDPVYITVLEEEFSQTVNFLAGQNPQTLSYQNVYTYVSRSAAGMAMASKERKPKWSLRQEHYSTFVLTAMLYVMQDFEFAKQLQSKWDELKKEKRSNLSDFFKTVVKGATMAVTMGLGLDIYRFYRWLTDKSFCYELVLQGERSCVQVYEPDVRQAAERFIGGKLGADTTTGYAFEMKLNSTTFEVKPKCEFLVACGDTGKQEIRCMHEAGQGKTTTVIEYSADDMQSLRGKLVAARDGQANDGLSRTIDKFIDELPMTGFRMEVQFEMLVGAFGVGKSKFARDLMAKQEKLGNSCVVIAPFSKLSEDYPTLPKGDMPGFRFYTQHKIAPKGMNIAFVDEYTALDEDLMLVNIFHSGAKQVFLCGDEKQTGVLPEEGKRIGSPVSRLNFDLIRAHVLTSQFRSPMWCVALANVDFGYCIRAMNRGKEGQEKPRILPLSEVSKAQGPVMTFSKATAQWLEQNQGEENTIRSNQGSTHTKGSYIALRDSDETLIRTDPLFIVSFSRFAYKSGLTIYCDPGPSKVAIESRLRLHDEDFWSKIEELSWPDLDAFYGPIEIDSRGGELTAVLEQLSLTGQVEFAGQTFDVKAEAEAELARRKKRADDKAKIFRAALETKMQYCTECAEHVPASWVQCQVCSSVVVAAKDFGLVRKISPDNIPEILSEEIDLSDVEEELEWEEAMAISPEDISLKPSDGYQWCTFASMLKGPEETEQERALRAAKLRGKAAKNELAKPLRSVLAPPIELVSDYKSYVVEKFGEGRGFSGIPLTVMKKFLDIKGVGYILEEVQESTGLILETFIKISEHMVYVSAVKDHAAVMSYSRYLEWTTPTKVSVTDENRTREISLLMHLTVEEFEEQHSGKRLLDRHGRYAARHLSLMEYRQKAGGSIFLVSRSTFGGVPIGGVSPRVSYVGATQMRNIKARIMRNMYDNSPYTETVVSFPLDDPQGVPASRSHMGGSDAYLLAKAIDPMAGATARANAEGAAIGPTLNMNGVRYNPNGLIYPLNARGRPLPGVEIYNAFSGGYGKVQTAAPWETLGCMQRMANRRTKRLTLESMKEAYYIAKANIRRNYDSTVERDPVLETSISAGASATAINRNYDGRADAEANACMSEFDVNLFNKRQFKADNSSKPGDMGKVGQGISAVSPATNLKWGAYHRKIGAQIKRAALPHNIYDCFEGEDEIIEQFFDQASDLLGFKVTTFDCTECDSRQDAFTQLVERWFYKLLGFEHDLVDQYFFEAREEFALSARGLAKLQVRGPKPSGAPDTLNGNTSLCELIVNYLMETNNRHVHVKKGDDVAWVQTSAKMRQDRRMLLKRYTHFDVFIVHGQADFCGKAITGGGMYPNVVKQARRAMAYGAKTYAQWAEYQISLREKVNAALDMGLEQVCVASSQATGIDLATVRAHFDVMFSLAHISEQQWREGTSRVQIHAPLPPMADGTLRPYVSF